MHTFLSHGVLFIVGAPSDNTEFSERLYRHVSPVATWQEKSKRWRVPMNPDTVKGLRQLGITLPPELAAWEAEQTMLAGRRDKANEIKAMSGREVKALLDKAGVRFHGRPLKEHQLIATAYALRLPACGLFMDTGTGKTAVAATVFQALVDKKDYKRIIVVAPKTILDLGWGRDLDEFSRVPWINISDPPPRRVVNECPRCHRVFKGHVSWAHLRTHMKGATARLGEEPAKFALFTRHPELMPLGWGKLPTTKCPICGHVDSAHIGWNHLKKHAPPCSTKAEERIERDAIYARYPELTPMGSVSKRRRLLDALEDDGHRVFLINPEGFKLVIGDLIEQPWDMIVVDESSILKSPRSAITQKTVAFSSGIKRRMAMTATPRPNTALDLHGQMNFLDQSLGGNYYRFREEYYYQGPDGYSWIPKDNMVNHLIWDIVAERSYRVRLEDCVDLEGETTEKMGVVLEGKLARHYDEMRKTMETELDDGRVVDTKWAIVQLNKLAQITSGYVFDNDGVPEYLGDSPKITATVDMARRLIDEGRRVVIWVRFPQTEGRQIKDALSKFGVSELHGHMSKARGAVQKSVGDFLTGPHHVMIAHVRSAKFGHTWVESNVDIFHSYDYSWENFYQAKRRIYRMGQESPATHIVCLALGTVDEEIIDAVFDKEAESAAVVDENIFAALRRRRACDRQR